MPRVIITSAAARGLERCRKFLVEKNPLAAQRAAIAIKRTLALLENHPEIGRPHPEQPDLRELIISFGDSGYIALYHFEPTETAVYILAFRHQKEAAYQ